MLENSSGHLNTLLDSAVILVFFPRHAPNEFCLQALDLIFDLASQVAPWSAPATASSSTLTLTIHKEPLPAQYSLTVRPTDSIAQIKQQLVHAYPAASPADTQRRARHSRTTSSPAPPQRLQAHDLKGSPSLSPSAGVTAGKGHQRIPSVVLSPSPSAEAPPGDFSSSPGSSSPSTRSRQNSIARDITLTLDNATRALAEQELSTYHAGIANPQLWQACSRIWGPPSPADVRDQAGVTGMGRF
ncbi:hypothetical protein C8J57DRAFT_1516150 [Mycena rebaudengoi]|nr:hypothetical protein C8J57DRAFT_1516150 [Mycena rebaudengoi]